ncbi:hypothetical protein K502DRAFT_343005 [Neoconidiobolus thromboides FSU 785]|nr:hypothetical protein K502DRAFT_343005 [Neoconidiobolus thromboides FSU 785]
MDSSLTNNTIEKARKKRIVLNMHDKKAIVKLVNKGMSHKMVAEKFNVARSTITKLALRKEEILNYPILDNDPRKCFKKETDDEVGNHLYKWCTEGRELDLKEVTMLDPSLSLDFIINKAKEIADDLDLTSLIINTSWARKFLRSQNQSELNTYPTYYQSMSLPATCPLNLEFPLLNNDLFCGNVEHTSLILKIMILVIS